MPLSQVEITINEAAASLRRLAINIGCAGDLKLATALEAEADEVIKLGKTTDFTDLSAVDKFQRMLNKRVSNFRKKHGVA